MGISGRKLQELACQSSDLASNADQDITFLVCLPVPSLSIRYLLKEEGFPLSRFTAIVGPPDSQKTSFAVEIARWHYLSGGGGLLIHTEGKISDDLVYGIVQHNRDALGIVRASTVQDWMKQVTGVIDQVTKGTSGKKPTVEEGPICLIVDTLTGVTDESEYQYMAREYAPRAHYSTTARLVSDHLRYITNQLWNIPVSYIGVNHLKFQPNMIGPAIPYTPGGVAPDYAISLRFVLKRKEGTTITSATDDCQVWQKTSSRTYYGNVISMYVTKNSTAPRSSLESVPFVWYTDYDQALPYTDLDGQEKLRYRQVFYFDWNYATTAFLADLINRRTDVGRMLRKTLDLSADERSKSAWSETLNVDQSSAVDWSTMGQLIEDKLTEDKEWRYRLYGALGIHPRPMYDSSRPYRDQLQAAACRSIEPDMSQTKNSGSKKHG